MDVETLELSDLIETTIVLPDNTVKITPPRYDVKTFSSEAKFDVLKKFSNVSLLEKLWDDKDAVVREAVVSNPAVTEEILTRFLVDPNKYTNYYILFRIFAIWKYDFNTLMKFYENVVVVIDSRFVSGVKLGLLSNRNCSEEVMFTLASENNDDFSLKIISRSFAKRDVSDRVLGVLAEECSRDVVLNLMEHENLSLEVVEKLAKNYNWRVRLRVAKNRKTPATVLFSLMEDEDQDVREAVITNPNYTVELLLEEFCKF